MNSRPKIEWVFDTAFRFLPVLSDPRAGFVLHPIDLAINKVFALVGRDEARDYLDTIDAHHARRLTLVAAALGHAVGHAPPA